jgi:hypothetical protein
VEVESRFRYEPRFKPARGAYKKDFGIMARDQFLCDGKRGDDVTACTAAGNENTEGRQC